MKLFTYCAVKKKTGANTNMSELDLTCTRDIEYLCMYITHVPEAQKLSYYHNNVVKGYIIARLDYSIGNISHVHI